VPYMKKNKLKYRFVSTYKETIFLKQERSFGKWTLYYSKPIQHKAANDLSNQIASFRERFYYLVRRTANGFIADNRQQQWVSPLPQAPTIRRISHKGGGKVLESEFTQPQDYSRAIGCS
jgi:hypothetical protein